MTTYEQASRERKRLHGEIGERAFAELWDESVWPGWTNAVIRKRMYEAVRDERFDRDAILAERGPAPTKEAQA